jgi:hypothetical protein
VKWTLTRRLIVLAAWPLLLAASRHSWAQRAPRVARVGILSQGGPPPQGTRWPVHRIFVERLRELGWSEGVTCSSSSAGAMSPRPASPLPPANWRC